MSRGESAPNGRDAAARFGGWSGIERDNRGAAFAAIARFLPGGGIAHLLIRNLRGPAAFGARVMAKPNLR